MENASTPIQSSEMISNLPYWGPEEPRAAKGFQEVWYLKFNDPDAKRALWLRFTLLKSANLFKQVSETWAIFFEEDSKGEVQKLAFKQSFDIERFEKINDSNGTGFKIDDTIFTDQMTRGSIQSKGRKITWDLQFVEATTSAFNMVPDTLAKAGIVKNTAATVFENLRFSGSIEVDGRKIEWKDAPGMQGHLSGPKNGHSWAWGQCNAFVDESGQPADLIFDGLSAKARLMGSVPTPRLSTFYFYYRGEHYHLNSFWNAVRSKSDYSLTNWQFQADAGDLSFRGTAHSEIRDFAGVTYEDTDGTYLYCANSKMSDMTIHVYRKGKLEATFNANGTAAFEVVSRQKNPYVPILI